MSGEHQTLVSRRRRAQLYADARLRDPSRQDFVTRGAVASEGFILGRTRNLQRATATATPPSGASRALSCAESAFAKVCARSLARSTPPTSRNRVQTDGALRRESSSVASEDVGLGGVGGAEGTASKRKPGQEEEEEGQEWRRRPSRLQSRPFLSVQFGARSHEELVRGETGEEHEFWPTQRKRLKVGL